MLKWCAGGTDARRYPLHDFQGMAATIIHEIGRRSGEWAMCLHGTRLVSLERREHAMKSKSAEVIARHHFAPTGRRRRRA